MSRWLYPMERRVARRRIVRDALVIVAVMLVLLFLLGGLDRAAYQAAFVGDPRLNDLEGRDWYRALRVAGTLWVWAPLCIAVFVQAREPSDRDGVVRTLGAAIVGGLAASIIEFVAGRLRPNQAGGAHVFRGIVGRFDNTHDLAFPSSHAAVAFAAAFMVWRVWPRAGVVALVVACGCGWTRMLSGAHFATDVLGAAVLGYAVARLLRPGGWLGNREGLLLP